MSSAPVSEKVSRRLQRVPLSLPIRVESKVNRSIVWNEITRLSDVSAFGAGFNLTRPVKRGRLVYMTLPMPRQLRSFDLMEPQYKVWGLVRRCIPILHRSNGESYAHGVAFIGKHPPISFLENPAKLYEITYRDEEGLWNFIEAASNPDETLLPKDQRRHTRFQIPVTILIEKLDEDGNVSENETTVTENLSLSGASTFTTLNVNAGDFVRVTSEQYKAAIIAVVRGRRNASEGISRLHLEFIDHFFPLEGIE
jgi:hypothetical protein